MISCKTRNRIVLIYGLYVMVSIIMLLVDLGVNKTDTVQWAFSKYNSLVIVGSLLTAAVGIIVKKIAPLWNEESCIF